MRLKDKVAIITGGSRGIGFATADKFLKEGASVVLAASSQESADVAVDKLKEKYPNAIVAGISPNLASMESVRKAFKEATEKYGCVDILVNNAGISENTSFMDYTEETFDKVIDLNVKGVFNTTRVAAECMVARGKGVILSTSSMVSISGQPSGFAYPASKFAVNGLTVSLARELGPKGIRVNAVAPGITETDIMNGRDVEMIGLDLKKDVIAHCNRMAEKYEYASLHFLEGDISTYDGADSADMVITLHACDVATDFALDKAVHWNAKVILSVPCCQHELNAQIENDMLEPLLKYGILKERFAALLTDALRANLLEQNGYEVQILEFIDMEHTPKNLLIRAVKRGEKADKKQEKLENSYKTLCDELNAHGTLEKILNM